MLSTGVGLLCIEGAECRDRGMGAAEIAEHLGKAEDATLYREYESGCKTAYQELVEKPDFSLDTDRQAVLVRPLYMNLLNEKQTDFARQRLLQAVKNYRYRVGTGFLSTPLILDVLDDIDLDGAYRMLENEEMPSWLFMTKAGATTGRAGKVPRPRAVSLPWITIPRVLCWNGCSG